MSAAARPRRAPDLLGLLEAAGLTGRGGAAFSTATKVAAAHDRGAELVVNACDGEVGAAKDAYVVAEHLPELLHGAALVGRGRVRWAAHRGSASAARLRDAGLDLLEVPPRYVSSEESSLVQLAHGGLARPVTKRVPVVHGSRDPDGRSMRPTVVLNAETLWRVAQITEHGPEWFRSYGTPAEPGPRLVTVGGAVTRPGVVGTEAGTAFTDLVAAVGGTVEPAAALGVGGLGGGWLTWAEAQATRWTGDELRRYGLGLGPGVLHVLPGSVCPLEHVASLLGYAAGESAGQCGPCMFGVPALAADVAALASGRLEPGRYGRLRVHLAQLPARGACRFPDGVAGFTAGALRAFADEVDAHLVGTCTHDRRGATRARARR